MEDVYLTRYMNDRQTFHFTDIMALSVELLMPGFSSSKDFLASLLKWHINN